MAGRLQRAVRCAPPEPARTLRRRPVQAAITLFAAIIVIPTLGVVAVGHIVHQDLEQRARDANSEVAGQLASSIGQEISERLRLTAGAGALDLPAGGGSTSPRSLISASLSILAADGGFCNVRLQLSPTVAYSAGVAGGCRSDTVDGPVGHDGVEVLGPQRSGNVVLAGYQAPVVLAPGRWGTLRTTYALTGISGPFRVKAGETVSLVDDAGLVVQSSSPLQVGVRALAPRFLALLRAHRPGSAQIWSPHTQATVVFSYQPIEGTAYGVVSAVPASLAYAAAHSLQRLLLIGYLVFLLLAAAVAGTGSLVLWRDLAERLRAERALATAAGRQRAILDTIPDGVILYDVDDEHRPRPVLANPAARSLLGLSSAQPGARLDELGLDVVDEGGKRVPADELPPSLVARDGKPIDGAVRGVRRAGVTRWVRSSTRPITGADGKMTGMVSCLVDVTDERAVHAEVVAAHARYAALIEHGSDLICVVDAGGRLRYLSPAYGRTLGWSWDLIGSEVEQHIHPDDLASVRASLAHLVERDGNVARVRCRVRTLGGDYRHLDVTCSNRLADPSINGLVTNSRDVTDEVEASELLRHQATHDPLTGLANRTLLVDRLERALVAGHCAVLFVDLDHFKRVNDTLGHGAGDDLLEVVANRLTSTLRPSDSVARVGGDEFVVLAEGVNSSDAALTLATRIRAAVTQPVHLSTRTVTVSCSVGIALARPTMAGGPEVLLQEADTALYQAKERGRNRAEIYDTAMRVRTQQRLDAETLVRTALDDHHLAVVFQPIIDLGTGLAVGTEALARLRGPNGTLLGPDRFIDAAEDSGLIVPLGAGVLDMACAQQAAWAAAGAPIGRVSVNVSARQLSEPGLAEVVRAALDRHGLSPSQLCLELTESSLIDAGETTRRAIAELRGMGIMLALDDFGTGWSSLAYLRRFPIDIIKIDRSFVSGLGVNSNDTEVVRAVVGLGRALGLTTVAEGVETADQAEQLRTLGCQHAQGYLYSRPVTAEQLRWGANDPVVV